MGKGRAPCCDKSHVKKGPWTPEEDLKLATFVRKYGHENWRALPKQAGLLRCGKSCRLRWINYLRPDVKRGNFTIEEEETIIKLHQSLGNKWSKIASHLPGRTDNEIKNVWNTHLKKRFAANEEAGNEEADGGKDSSITTSSSSTSQSSTSIDLNNRQNECGAKDFDSTKEVIKHDHLVSDGNTASVTKDLSSSFSNSNLTNFSNQVLDQQHDQVGSLTSQFGGEFSDHGGNHWNTVEELTKPEIEDFPSQILVEAGYDFWSMFESFNLPQSNQAHQQNAEWNYQNSMNIGDQAFTSHNEIENKPWMHHFPSDFGSNGKGHGN